MVFFPFLSFFRLIDAQFTFSKYLFLYYIKWLFVAVVFFFL